MDFGIKGKVALISGGTSGIGLGAAQALLNEGVNVAIFSRNQENLDRAGKELVISDARLITLQGDLSDPSSVDTIIKTVEEELGSIDIYVGSSGGPAFGQAQNLTHEDFVKALESNFVAIASLTNKLLGSMKSKKWGRIVFVTTSGVIQPVANLALSNVARSALTSFTKTLAIELAAEGITVNSVIPGKIETKRLEQVTRNKAEQQNVKYEDLLEKEFEEIPAHRYGRVEEIADLIAFLCSDNASYITGSKIAVDGAYIKTV